MFRKLGDYRDSSALAFESETHFNDSKKYTRRAVFLNQDNWINSNLPIIYSEFLDDNSNN